jgi:hypothetical protein
VLRVDRKGRLSLLAGSRRSGSSGDGGPATAARFSGISDLAVAADGALLIADGARVRRVGADGRISTLLPSGTRGRCVVSGVATIPSGGFLVAESECHRVLEIDAQRRARTIAGTGVEGKTPASGPATAGPLSFPQYVAATPSGPVVVDTVGMRRIGSDGVMRTLAVAPGADFWQSAEVLADGSVLTAPAFGFDGEAASLFTIDPTGHGRHVAGSEYVGFDGDGQPAGTAPFSILDTDVTPGGDVLVAEAVRVRRIEVQPPSMTTIALTPATLRAPDGSVRPEVYVNQPGRVRITVRGREGVIARAQTVVNAGTRRLSPIPHARRGLYEVRAETTSSSGGRAVDLAYVVPGAVLPVRVARAVVDADAAFTQAVGGGGGTSGPCRRFSARRVDCSLRAAGICQFRSAFVLRPNGTVAERRYAAPAPAFGRPCVLRRNVPLRSPQAIDWQFVLDALPRLVGR